MHRSSGSNNPAQMAVEIQETAFQPKVSHRPIL